MKKLIVTLIFFTIIVFSEQKSFGELNRYHFLPKHPAFSSFSEGGASLPLEEASCGSIHHLDEGDVFYFRNKDTRARHVRSFHKWPQYILPKVSNHKLPLPFPVQFPISPFDPSPYIIRRTRPRQYVKARICAWKFQTESSCQLVANFEHYEGGDLNCNRQYLLLSDEERELQICGFAPFPGFFKSFGKTLVIKHLRKPQTWSSDFEGYVTCVKSKHNSEVLEFGSASLETLDKENRGIVLSQNDGDTQIQESKNGEENERIESPADELEDKLKGLDAEIEFIITTSSISPNSETDEIEIDENSGSASGKIFDVGELPERGYGYPVDPEDTQSTYNFEDDGQNLDNENSEIISTTDGFDASSSHAPVTTSDNMSEGESAAVYMNDGFPQPKPLPEPTTELSSTSITEQATATSPLPSSTENPNVETSGDLIAAFDSDGSSLVDFGEVKPAVNENATSSTEPSTMKQESTTAMDSTEVTNDMNSMSERESAAVYMNDSLPTPTPLPEPPTELSSTSITEQATATSPLPSSTENPNFETSGDITAAFDSDGSFLVDFGELEPVVNDNATSSTEPSTIEQESTTPMDSPEVTNNFEARGDAESNKAMENPINNGEVPTVDGQANAEEIQQDLADAGAREEREFSNDLDGIATLTAAGG